MPRGGLVLSSRHRPCCRWVLDGGDSKVGEPFGVPLRVEVGEPAVGVQAEEVDVSDEHVGSEKWGRSMVAALVALGLRS